MSPSRGIWGHRPASGCIRPVRGSTPPRWADRVAGRAGRGAPAARAQAFPTGTPCRISTPWRHALRLWAASVERTERSLSSRRVRTLMRATALLALAFLLPGPARAAPAPVAGTFHCGCAEVRAAALFDSALVDGVRDALSAARSSARPRRAARPGSGADRERCRLPRLRGRPHRARRLRRRAGAFPLRQPAPRPAALAALDRISRGAGPEARGAGTCPADPGLPAGAGPVSARPAAARSALRLALLPDRPARRLHARAAGSRRGGRGVHRRDAAARLSRSAERRRGRRIDRMMRLTFDAPEARGRRLRGPAGARGLTSGKDAGIVLLGSGFEGGSRPCRRERPAARRWWRAGAPTRSSSAPPVPACGASGSCVHL